MATAAKKIIAEYLWILYLYFKYICQTFYWNSCY